MRDIPSSMAPAVVADIDARLDAIARDHSVTIAFAIESGSRAWGFPSPDSDYDCRFVFIRPRQEYLSLFRKRDVIETPLTPVLDVNGWDLGKALKLLLKGNAVIIEWLTSPIVYQAKVGFREDLLALAMDIADRDLIGRHYLHLAWRTRAQWLSNPEQVALKKLFYVLRPALALRWLRQHPQARVAPMHFPTLCAQSALDGYVASEIERLLELKAATREMGTGVAPTALMELIGAELSIAEASGHLGGELSQDATAKADAFFIKTLDAQRS
jgi:uncharacterized protein